MNIFFALKKHHSTHPLRKKKKETRKYQSNQPFCSFVIYRWCADFVCGCLCVVITAIRIGFKLITFGRFNFDFHTNGTQIKSIRGWWFWLRPMMMIKPTYIRQHVARVLHCCVARTFLANWMYRGVYANALIQQAVCNGVVFAFEMTRFVPITISIGKHFYNAINQNIYWTVCVSKCFLFSRHISKFDLPLRLNNKGKQKEGESEWERSDSGGICVATAWEKHFDFMFLFRTTHTCYLRKIGHKNHSCNNNNRAPFVHKVPQKHTHLLTHMPYFWHYLWFRVVVTKFASITSNIWDGDTARVVASIKMSETNPAAYFAK